MRKSNGLFYGIAITAIALLLCACGDRSSAQVSAEAVEDITESPKYLALTFDDGPRASTTARLLDGLQERGIHATFFLVGEQIEGNEDLVRRMKEEGHQIGNHTWSHRELISISEQEVEKEISGVEQRLEELLGPGKYWLRPPYGKITPVQQTYLTEPIITWSVDSRDWEVPEDAEAVILREVKPNGIILMHDIYDTSVDTGLAIVDQLKEAGYQFVTVQELLDLNGILPEAGKIYRSGDGE